MDCAGAGAALPFIRDRDSDGTPGRTRVDAARTRLVESGHRVTSSRAGRLEYPEAEKTHKTCYERLKTARQEMGRVFTDLTAMNPAFDPAVQARVRR